MIVDFKISSAVIYVLRSLGTRSQHSSHLRSFLAFQFQVALRSVGEEGRN